MTSTFSIPIRRRSLDTNSAARWTSALCSGAVLTLGMRSRSFNSLRNRCWFWRANSTAGEAMGVLSDAPKTSQYSEKLFHHRDTEPQRKIFLLRQGRLKSFLCDSVSLWCEVLPESLD